MEGQTQTRREWMQNVTSTAAVLALSGSAGIALGQAKAISARVVDKMPRIIIPTRVWKPKVLSQLPVNNFQ